MTTLYPRAVWREVTSEANDPPIIPVGVILHVAGGEAKSLFGYFDGPSGGIESHLHIARAPLEAGGGGIEQYRDLENEADANYHGNSWIGGDGRRYGFHSVETQGGADGPWNAYQLEELAQFLAWDSERFGFPLELCTDPKDPGVGWHVMWGAPGEWTPAQGKVCPGPDRIAQIPALLARARVIAAGEPAPPAPPTEDDMPTPIVVEIPPADRLEDGVTVDTDPNGRPKNARAIGIPNAAGTVILYGQVHISVYADEGAEGDGGPVRVWGQWTGGDGKPYPIWPVDGWSKVFQQRSRSGGAGIPEDAHGVTIAHDSTRPVSVLIEVRSA